MTGDRSLPLDAKNWQRLFKPVQDCNAEAPPELCELIHKCLAYDARQRPERMAEIHESLEQIAEKFGRVGENLGEAVG